MTIFRSLSLNVFFCGLLAIGCSKKQPETQWLDAKTIQPSPILHEKLTDDQLARIAILQKTFSEVDPQPLERWIQDFSRDQDPTREIEIWEGMVEPYKKFLAAHVLGLEAKKEVYQVVLMRSGSSTEETLSHIGLKVLTPAQVREILSNYKNDPKPIRVYSE